MNLLFLYDPTKNGPGNKKQFTLLEKNPKKTFETRLKCTGIKSFALLSSYFSRNGAESISILGKPAKLGVKGNMF